MLQLSADVLERIRNAVNDKQIFLVVDDSSLSGIQYLNILVGSLEHLTLVICTTVNLYHMRQISTALLKQLTVLLVLKKSAETLGLLLSDAAKYVVAAGAVHKSLYPKLFHVTCVAHLLYN